MAFNLPSVEKLKNIRVKRISIIGSTEVSINWSDVAEKKKNSMRCVIISIGEDTRKCYWNGQSQRLN